MTKLGGMDAQEVKHVCVHTRTHTHTHTHACVLLAIKRRWSLWWKTWILALAWPLTSFIISR